MRQKLSSFAGRARAYWDNPFVRFSAFYTFLFGAGAFVLPFYAVYLQSLGWSGTEIGALTLVQRLTSFLSSPAIGWIADKTKRHRLVVFATCVGTPLLTGLIPALADSHAGVWIAILLSTIVRSGTVPICDRSIVRWFKLRGATSSRYGRVRLWGAVGWGLGSLLVGFIVDAAANYNALFISHAVCFVVAVFPLMFSLQFPPLDEEEAAGKVPPPTDKEEDGAPAIMTPLDDVAAATINGEAEAGPTEVAAPKGKLLSVDTAVFFTIVLAQGIFMGIIATALFLFLTELGASTSLLGGTLLATCVSEVPFFFFSEKIVAKLTPHGVLVFASWCLALRLVLYSALPHYPIELILPVELLHGVTYALMWSAAVSFAAHVATPKTEATLQGVLGGLYFGAGSGVGGAIGGWAYQTYGGVQTFQTAALINVGIASIFTAALFGSKIVARIQERCGRGGGTAYRHLPEDESSTAPEKPTLEL